ncbi:MAG: enoyl-CoA hydratase-related protein [Acidimicrobiales bacterium]
MIDTTGFTCLRFETLDEGALLRVVIDRPGSELNAVDEALHHDLTTLFARLRPERDLRAVVLTGTPGAFSAGGDFGWFPTLRTPERLAELRVDAKAMIWDLLDVEVPIVAAIGGPAIGLGASVALLCDVIVASNDAVIGDPHVKVGLVAGDGGAVIWPLVLGPARAKEYLLTGDTLTATDAAALGLINRVVDPADLQGEALAVARRIAANPPLAVRFTKAAVNKGVRERMETLYDYAAALELTTFLSHDHAEAIDAIVERRAPNFEGR